MDICYRSLRKKQQVFSTLVAILLLTLTALLSSPTILAQSVESAQRAKPEASITLWNRNFDTAPVDKILSLALRNTEDLYPTTLIKKSKPLEQGEAIEDMLNGRHLDVMSAASSSELDPQLIALRFPILQGLLGHRLCLIRKGDQARFDGLATAHDFRERKIRICQGTHWPDTKILKRNGLLVEDSESYHALFDRLKSGGCDCFLRGAQEIWPEYQSRHSDFEIERDLVVRYQQPGVVYVKKNNPALAVRLELGLLRSLENGSYQALMDELLGEQLKNLRLSERQPIVINNPERSELLKTIEQIPAFSVPSP